MMIRGSVIMALLALAMPLGVQAAPIYSINHNADAFAHTGPNESVGPQSTPASYSFSGIAYFTGANYGVVQASVNQGSIGIFANAFNNGLPVIQRQEVVAGFGFDVLFTSPTSDLITVSLNFDLAGEMSGLSSAGSRIETFVSTANAAGFQWSEGGYTERPTETLRNGMLASFVADGTKRTVSTGQFIKVPVNVPTQFNIQLKTAQVYSTTNPTVSFQDTFNLTTLGDVFTIHGPLADQISVNSADAGIVNNRFGQAASPVPEPSSIVLLGIGALSLLGFRRRFQTK